MVCNPHTLALALLLLPALACGGGGGERDLEAAARSLAEARAGAASARAAVEAKQAAAERARTELEEARRALLEAEGRLASAEAAVDSTATDALLFRAVQRKLLEDEALAEVAVQAFVEKGVVTLTGFVPDERIRERAIAIARGTAGVVDVEDRIAVEPAEREG
jgi:osmotically-inducible protein OsmY